MLEIEKLTKRFGDNTAVDQVTFSVPKAAFIGIIGRSGAGKSTFLRMINRLTDASAGRIVFDGRMSRPFRGAASGRGSRNAR